MIRPAATLCVLRPGEAGLEVLMVRRATGSAFVGGAHVFPGGAVEDVDRGSLAARAVRGAPSQTMRPWMAAALRETAEEAGVWITDPGLDETSAGRLVGVRGAELYLGLLETGRVFDAASVAYLSNWVTPDGPPRRFDTRFFVASVPGGTSAAPDAEEITDAHWVRPAEALERWKSDEWDLIVPTLKHLELLSRFSFPDQVMAYARRQPAVPRVEPRLVRDEEGAWRVVLPGEPGYAAGNVPATSEGRSS
ncbi:MAG: NUDIX domain-containing protein [Actinomycetota bacterium]|nr:NUDIX domain-containing protein [Actinomycetota bacterium]